MDSANKIADLLSFLTTIVALIIILTRKKRKDLIQIKLYIILVFIVNVIDIILFLYKNEFSNKIESAIVNIDSILEMSLLYSLLYNRITGMKFRIAMIIFYSIYLLICAFLWTSDKIMFVSFTPFLFGIEDLLITIPCLFYIHEILNSDLTIDLKSDSSFIATCGILFYFSISTPCCFSWYTLYYLSPGFEKILMFSNLICFTLLIISFMKAYLCPLPETQR